jgi:hypothetical protein
MASPRASAASFSFMAVSIAFLAFPELFFFFFFLVFFGDGDEGGDEDDPPRSVNARWWLLGTSVVTRKLGGETADTPHDSAATDSNTTCLDLIIVDLLDVILFNTNTSMSRMRTRGLLSFFRMYFPVHDRLDLALIEHNRTAPRYLS